MQAAIVIFPGSNREHDVAMALKRATGHEPVRVWHRESPSLVQGRYGHEAAETFKNN